MMTAIMRWIQVYVVRPPSELDSELFGSSLHCPAGYMPHLDQIASKLATIPEDELIQLLQLPSAVRSEEGEREALHVA